MKTKIKNFLSELNTEISILEYVDIDNIDHDHAFDSIYDMINDNNGFDTEIVYFSNAIKFLAENDPTLHESLALATEMGCEVGDLSSEILASLLYSKLVREEFYELEEEVNNFFAEMEEE